ncbi:MAG: hypothetical protein HF314_13280 [Ignavibacteria bacterium]|jgi:hypothetical protein|nr:hypothetical protein [Ignavibacteria bacterium]MCU7504049.1 hypothetical protein [Ignavibacteria bacterium]MCU7515421.1 hypothetical protein [Ignavibacteria bacterium]
MDLIQQYIVQCIISAANNLRLNTEKIEVVALIRENICQSKDLEADIQRMKKVTELSTFAIRLGEVYNFIAKSKVDFLKITEKFKEHSYYIVKDLNNLLERVSPQAYRRLIIQMEEEAIRVDFSLRNSAEDFEKEIAEEDLIPQVNAFAPVKFPEEKKSLPAEEKPGRTKQKQETATEENLLFEDYEARILSPIKELDAFLKKLAVEASSKEEIEKYREIMRKNADLSDKIGFEIIADMHKVFVKALDLLLSEVISPVREVVEGMRAALIVIVAVIRGKDVDIKKFLNKAEDFGRKIQNIN